MVNRAAVAVVAGVIIVAVLVGVVVGLLVGGGGTAAGPTGTPTPTDVQPTALPETTATPTRGSTPGSEPTTSTPAPTPPPTQAPDDDTTPSGDEPRTTIASDEFIPSKIESEIFRLVNERRRNRGLDPFKETGITPKLKRMARDLSDAMARIDEVTHVVDGTDVGERYENHQIYGACSWDAVNGNYIIKPDDPREAQLEVIANTTAGRPYTNEGETRFNGNETAVARAIVEEWFEGYPHEDKLTLPGASHFGVGVHVTLSGTVYVTGNLC